MDRVQRWERRAEIPLILLAIAFLVAYAWPVLDRDLSPDLRTVLTVASWAVWAAFVLDFAARLHLADHRAAGTLVGRVFTYVAGVTVLSIGLGAIAVLDAEQDAEGANITAFGDALWWATTTITTVGYGDHFPVTTPGRLVAVTLMLVGIASIGAVTAGVAAWFVTHVAAEGEADASSHT